RPRFRWGAGLSNQSKQIDPPLMIAFDRYPESVRANLVDYHLVGGQVELTERHGELAPAESLRLAAGTFQCEIVDRRTRGLHVDVEPGGRESGFHAGLRGQFARRQVGVEERRG